jgi:carboxymethylenebutenolidase
VPWVRFYPIYHLYLHGEILSMCYDAKALPPEPPGAAGAAQGQDIVLTASDGNHFAAYLATPAGAADAKIVIYPDVRGLHQFYKELALRFAGIGITALAIDYFGRTAGLTARDESFEFWPHVEQVRLDSFSLDVQAALKHLRQTPNSDAPVFVVGFCMGGSYTLLTGTDKAFNFAGLIPFYAGLSRARGGRGTVLENAGRITYPVMGFFGGADTSIPESEVKQLDETLAKTGVSHELVTYPGAPHSFFDRRATEFADASTDAWRRLLEFIAAHKHAH